MGEFVSIDKIRGKKVGADQEDCTLRSVDRDCYLIAPAIAGSKSRIGP